VTIEGSRVEADDHTRVQTDGWGIAHHECKDPAVIWRFIEENRYYDDQEDIVLHEE